jgi:hypothetical protein
MIHVKGAGRAEAAPIAGDSNNLTPGVTAVNTSTNIALAAVSGQAVPPSLGGAQPVIFAFNANNNQKGIRGSATGTSSIGVEGAAGLYGVHGTSSGQFGVKGVSVVDGPAAATFAGVWGTSQGNTGVFGTSTNGTGAYGIGGTFGVRGGCSAGPGVRGDSDFSFGMFGRSANGDGVRGESPNGRGVVGASSGSAGVAGFSDTSAGVYGWTQAPGVAAVVGESAAVALPMAGFFQGGVLVSGNFQVLGGVKNAVVPMGDGSHAQVYCQESPEPYFEDFGRANLVNGVATVDIEPQFASIVHRQDYLVFITPGGDSNGLYVSRQTPQGFEVREARGGRSSLPFTYRIVAKRRDVQAQRLQRVDPQILKTIERIKAKGNLKKESVAPAGESNVPKLAPAPSLIERP